MLNPGQTNSTSFTKGHPTWNKGLRGTQKAWNKGLTKDTDARVKKISTALLGQPHPWMTGYPGRPGPNLGRVISDEECGRISRSMKKARRTYAPIWNKGLTKATHPGIASAAKKNSLLMKGRPRPFTSKKQGIRRFWYYGDDCRLRMRSRWEVAFAHWLDSIGEEWLYEPVTFITDRFSYTPDFYKPDEDEFIEVKGAAYNVHEEKMFALRNHWGTKLTMLNGQDLQKLGILDERYKVIANKRQVL